RDRNVTGVQTCALPISSWAAAATGGQAPIDLDPASFRELDQVRDISAEHGHAWWSIGPFGLDIDSDIHRADLEPAPLYRGDTDAALTDVNTWRHAGRAVKFVEIGRAHV